MKKKLMFSIGVLAIAVVVSLNINLAKTDSNSLAFMNIQALAGETGGGESVNLDRTLCKTTFTTSYVTYQMRIVTSRCEIGSKNVCSVGVEKYEGGILQAGYPMTRYACNL